jgi:hypothetical protein
MLKRYGEDAQNQRFQPSKIWANPLIKNVFRVAGHVD